MLQLFKTVLEERLQLFDQFLICFWREIMLLFDMFSKRGYNSMNCFWSDVTTLICLLKEVETFF